MYHIIYFPGVNFFLQKREKAEQAKKRKKAERAKKREKVKKRMKKLSGFTAIRRRPCILAPGIADRDPTSLWLGARRECRKIIWNISSPFFCCWK